jgi:hypothetical protein
MRRSAGRFAGVSAMPRHQRLADERGSALLETALAIPVLAGVTLALLWGLGLGITALALGDTARNAARAIARGEPADQVAGWVSSQAPRAQVHIHDQGDLVTVLLTQEFLVPVPVLDGAGTTVRQSATAAKELRPW